MIARFYDATSGGFFDSEPAPTAKSWRLATRRKPLQDSPTPAGNPMAAIALIRLHHYTDDAGYRDKAEQTLETFAGVAEQFGIFAATYGIAVVQYVESPVQVVVIAGDGGDQRGRRTAGRGRCAVRIHQVDAAPGRESGGCGKPTACLGGHHSESSPTAVREIVRRLVFGIYLPAARFRRGRVASALETALHNSLNI